MTKQAVTATVSDKSKCDGRTLDHVCRKSQSCKAVIRISRIRSAVIISGCDCKKRAAVIIKRTALTVFNETQSASTLVILNTKKNWSVLIFYRFGLSTCDMHSTCMAVAFQKTESLRKQRVFFVS